MNVYRFDDGAKYHVVAKDVAHMLRWLMLVDAHDGWDDINGVEWKKLKPSDRVGVTFESGDDFVLPRDCHTTGNNHYTATAEAWAETLPEGGVLCCSEWP